MPRFRLKAPEVHAERYRAGLEDEWAHLWRDGVLIGRYETRHAAETCPNGVGQGYFGNPVPVILTGKGRTMVGPSDWIVTMPGGQRSVVKAGAFESIYELCDS